MAQTLGLVAYLALCIATQVIAMNGCHPDMKKSSTDALSNCAPEAAAEEDSTLHSCAARKGLAWVHLTADWTAHLQGVMEMPRLRHALTLLKSLRASRRP